jgi:predicted nucleotidyltransferase component of viral defense system|uniref:Nucleotidyl transferase AbiEii/AbiGii toxin family protein n=1 Tax=candidate division WOR-3 bacterium TaxID=2052148 RepID=A0A7C6AA53_UNCW3
MLDIINNLVAAAKDRETKIAVAREFLQLLVLKVIFDRGYFKNLAFVGGTALRFLYGLRRFSEDLDFSLYNKLGYQFSNLKKKIVYDLTKAGLVLDWKEQPQPPVQSVMLRFKDILFNLGLSNYKNEKLAIKIEIDANPPKGYQIETALITRHFVFTVTHFDLASLYALKLHACFFRPYTKGRDFYDLLWYLGRKELPNFVLLNNAIEQTTHKKSDINESNFKEFLKEQLAKIDFVKAKRDVARFIEDKNELKLMDKNIILTKVLCSFESPKADK